MTWFKKDISEGVKLLAESMLSNPGNWVQEAYHFRCISNPDIRLWTANGVGFLQLEGNKGFNSDERKYLNDTIKKTIALKIKGLTHD